MLNEAEAKIVEIMLKHGFPPPEVGDTLRGEVAPKLAAFLEYADKELERLKKNEVNDER